MVTASKVAAGSSQSPRLPQTPQTPGQSVRQIASSSVGEESRLASGASGLGAESEYSSEAEYLSDIPLTYGEQLVLETVFRSRQRPYNRQRQEELSKPRRRMAAPEPVFTQAPLSPKQVDDVVNRLYRLRAVKKGSESFDENCLAASTPKRSAQELEAIWNRLSALKPRRPRSPTPNEQVLFAYSSQMQQRRVDYCRLEEMSKPRKRGGTCASWGIYVPMSLTLPSISTREPDSRANWSADYGEAFDEPYSSMELPEKHEGTRPPDRGLF